jgi:alpha-galactosidase
MKIQNQKLSIKIHTASSFSLFTQEDSLMALAEGAVSLNTSGGPFKGEEKTTFVQHAEPVTTNFGQAKRIAITKTDEFLEITMQVDHYAEWPDCFVLQWFVRNIGQTDLTLDGMVTPRLDFSAALATDAWTMQGIATNWGQDFAFKVPHPFQRDNYLGHTDNGEGGGVPLLYAWNPIGGLALAHLEPTQALWTMPVLAEDENSLQFSLENREPILLPTGERAASLTVLISYHQGDFYAPLALYRELMQKQGLISPTPNAEDYQPAWCSWGYEFDVLPEEMTQVLPKLQEMNIRWLTLDDRWFDHYGDWNPRSDTFPGGEAQLKAMVDQIHAQKAYAQLWWYPLCVEDGAGGWENFNYGVSSLLEQHPDWLVQHKDGSTARNNRALAILCPALEEVKAYTLALTCLFIEEWGFDGHKLDNIYTVPPCYIRRTIIRIHRNPCRLLRNSTAVFLN